MGLTITIIACLFIVPIPMLYVFMGISDAIFSRMGTGAGAAIPGAIFGIAVTIFSWGVAFAMLLNELRKVVFS